MTTPTAQSGQSEEVPCSTHPDAPHGFDRNASHTEDRYVCDCEGWNPPAGARDAVTDDHVRRLVTLGDSLPKSENWDDYRLALMAAIESLTGKADARDGIHTCNYYCTRPACIRAQRDELVAAMEATQPAAPGMGHIEILRDILAQDYQPLEGEPRGYTLERAALTAAIGALAAQPAPVTVAYQGLRQQKAAREGVCLWTQQDDGYDTYSTGCGHEFTMNDCTDGNVQLPYCPFCALELKSRAWSAGNDETTPAQPAPVVGGDARDLIGQLVSLAAMYDQPLAKNIAERLDALLSTRPAESVAQGGADIEIAEAALERALQKFTERQHVDPSTGYGEYNGRDEEYHADLVSALDAVKGLHDVPPDRRNEDFDHE